MTQMPELRRPHAQPGGSGGLPGGLRELLWDTLPLVFPAAAEKTIHEVEIYVGIPIGAVTFSGSLVASPSSPARSAASCAAARAPLAQPRRADPGDPARALVPNTHSIWAGTALLLVMTLIALASSAVHGDGDGGADTPVVAPDVNSARLGGGDGLHARWQRSLIVVGALVGSSGAICSTSCAAR